MKAEQAKPGQETMNEKPGCLGRLIVALGLSPKPAEETTLPYQLRKDLLSAAEYSFYQVLRSVVEDWAIICPKVNLGDLFYPKTGDRSENTRYRNRIDRKHVDFLLCDPTSMRPAGGDRVWMMPATGGKDVRSGISSWTGSLRPPVYLCIGFGPPDLITPRNYRPRSARA